MLFFVAVILALLSRPVQTRVAHYVLDSVNRGLNGRIEVEAVQLRPSGVFSINGISLSDLDKEIAKVGRVRGRVHLFSLLNQSLDFDSLIIEGLCVEVDIDSHGQTSIENIFKESSTGKPPPKSAKPWQAHIRRFEVIGEELSLRKEDSTLFETKNMGLFAAIDFVPEELIVHKMELTADGFHLRGKGSWPLTTRGRGVGEANIHFDSEILHSIIGDETAGDTVEVFLYYSLEDSLRTQLTLEWPQVGTTVLGATVAWPVERIAGRVNGQIFGLKPERFTDFPGWLCGSFDVQGEDLLNKTASFSGGISLRNSSFDTHRIQRVDFQFAGNLDDISGSGLIHADFGKVTLTLRARDLESAQPHLEGGINLTEVRIQDFAPEVPGDFPLINGHVHGWLRGVQPFAEEGAVEVRLAPTAFGSIEADTILLTAEWQGDSLTLSRLHAAYKGASLQAHGGGIFDSTFRFHVELRLRDASELTPKLPISEELARTIMGALRVSADAEFRLDKSGLSDFGARAQIEGQSLAGGTYALRRLTLSVDTLRLSPLFTAGEIRARDGWIAEHQIDSAVVYFSGRSDSLAVRLLATLNRDSLFLQLTGIFGLDNAGGFSMDLRTLEVDAFEHHWSLEERTQFALDTVGFSLTDFNLHSDVGNLHAAGSLAFEGKQDFVLRLSDFQGAQLRRFTPFFDGRISAQLQLLGSSQSLIANFEIAAESLQWHENDWIDIFSAAGTLQGDSLVARGTAFWQGDTLIAFHGNVPMTFSLDKGVELPRDSDVTAYFRIYGQPLPKLRSFLPYGLHLGGWAGAEVDISGTLSELTWEGNFIVEDGSIEDIVHGLHYDKIYLNGFWRGDTLAVERIEARAGGKVRSHGVALMAFPLPESLKLSAEFDRFQILQRPDIRAKISGDVELDGPLLGLRAQGDITLDEMRYRITSATTKNVEEVDLEAELAKLRGDTATTFRVPGTLIYEKMDQALRVTLPRNCWVQGGGVNIELEGDVWFYKQPDEPEQVYGQIRVVRGTVSLYTRRLVVQEGTITFDGDPLDPNLDITAIEANLKRSRDVEIVLRLRGTKNHPEIELSGRDADGELSHEDIVSYLTLGRRAIGGSRLATSQETTEGSMLGRTAATGISSSVSGLVSKALGLDVFEFRPGSEGSTGLSQGELEVGTYVTDNLFISIIQSMEEERTGQTVIIEYQFLPWLRVRGTREADNQSGFDLFFHWEWR